MSACLECRCACSRRSASRAGSSPTFEDRIQHGIKCGEVALRVGGENEARAGLCDASALPERRSCIGEVIDPYIGDHQIEVCVREGHRCDVGLEYVDIGQAVKLKFYARALKRIEPDVDACEV